jgi:predicted TIM-barrel fold metal-dependent hydrolase
MATSAPHAGSFESPSRDVDTSLRSVTIVDCDVHPMPRGVDDIIRHAPPQFAPRLERGLLRQRARPGFNPLWDPMRSDAYPDSGGYAGTDPELARRQLFAEVGVDIAILAPLVFTVADPEANSALCHAFNHWLADEWLGSANAGRFYGSINVSLDDPVAALREVHEWADHPAFCQILVGHHADRAFGHPAYEPLWAAAADAGLPVAVHFSLCARESIATLSPTGPFERLVDFHSLAYSFNYAAHLVNLICSGVFDRHPGLRFVFLEGGFLWHRPVVARLARHWRSLLPDLAATRRDPFEYLEPHVRFTSQPIEEADRARDVATCLQIANADRLLLFSSDYPHYDFDAPARALPSQLPAATRRRIMCENAIDLYGLPSTRPRDALDRPSDL